MDRRRDQQALISARSHPSAHRRSIAAPAPWRRPRVPLIATVHSRQWRRRRGRAAHLARPQATRQGQPRPPAQSAWACPRQGCAIRRVRHWRDPACRRGHRNRAVTGHRCPRHSCRGGSIRRAAWAPSNRPKVSPCWSSPAIKTWKAGTPQNRLRRRCVGTRHSLNRDRSRTLRFQRRPHCLWRRKPLRPGSRSLLQAPSPRQRRKKGVGVGE